MQLRWKASFSASCLHAAACMHEGLPIADAAIAQKLQPYVQTLLDELTASEFVPEAALAELITLAADYENNRQLIEVAGKRLLGGEAISGTTVARIGGAVGGLETAWLREQPQLVEELAVRGRPLREQWEARGPGLLRAVKQLAGEELIAPSAEVVLVSPTVGGHGRSHLRHNRITFEAVLTHPYPEIPEIVRMGWLLAQLQLDVPMLSESVPQQRLPYLASLATVPLILKAAEHVELAALDEATLVQALQVWYLPDSSESTAQNLMAWWSTMQTGNTPWPVALAALDQMLASDAS